MSPLEIINTGERLFRFSKKLHKDMETKARCKNPENCGVRDWGWISGVYVYAVYRFYEETQKQEYLDWLWDWFDEQIALGLPKKTINSVCPMLTLLLIDQEGKYAKLLQEWASWVMEELPRTEEGGFQHIAGKENRQQMWMDTLFMTVLFVAAYGVRFDRQDMIEEAQFQYLQHVKYLLDPASGLFYHGWSFEGRHHFAGALWGRGNCWFTVGFPELCELLGGRIHDSVKRSLAGALSTQAAALKKCQRPSGAWGTLLDQPDSYEELSATAGFAAGMRKAIRMGLLPDLFEPVCEKAERAMLSSIDEAGALRNVSGGTPMGDTLDFYKTIPVYPIVYGQGLAMLSIAEWLRWAKAGLEGREG